MSKKLGSLGIYPLFLTLNRLATSFCSFHCWLRTNEYRLGRAVFSIFIKTNQWFFRSLTIVAIFQSNCFFQVCVFYLYSKYVSFPFRFFTLIFEQYVKVDVKALRAFRVLRPLRLVSGVPSKLTFYYQNKTAVMVFPFNSYFRFFHDLVFNQSKYTKLRPKTRVRDLPNV